MSYLKINSKNHLIALFSLIVSTILLTGLWIWSKFDREFGLVFLIAWVLDALPAFYLHLEYYFINNKQEIEINYDGIHVKNKDGDVHFFRIDELEKITLYKSASLDRGGIQLLAMTSYHYVRITTKSGYEVIITSLLVARVEDAIKKLAGISYTRKRRLFCAIAWK